ncbi:MAG: MarR family transcriptional regulator [Nitrososphaerales archaeon]
MGGTKKKSMSQADKAQSAQDAAQAGKKPEKKTGKDARLAQQQAKQQALIPPKMDEKQLLKALSPLKAITVYGTARALGLNAAIASQTLRTLEAKNSIRKVGGYSGHYIYAVSPSSTSIS